MSCESTTKQIDITLSGSDASAVSHQMHVTILELMTKLKKQNGNRVKRKRKRGAGQSTHLGKSGVTLGILMHRRSAETEKEELEKEKKALVDEAAKMQALLEKMISLKDEKPNDYWKHDSVKGAKRETLAKLFGIYKTSMKAQPLTDALKSLNLTRRKVDEKMNELKESVADKEACLPECIAQIRERDDVLESTAEYVGAADNVDEED